MFSGRAEESIVSDPWFVIWGMSQRALTGLRKISFSINLVVEEGNLDKTLTSHYAICINVIQPLDIKDCW